MGYSIVRNLTTDTWHQRIYMYMLYASYILYAFALSGSVFINPAYLTTLETVLKYYVCIFLIIRFNPYFNPRPKSQTSRFNQRISYHAGVFLLLTTALTGVIKTYIHKLHHVVVSDLF